MNVEYLIEKYSKLIYKICIDMLTSPSDAEDMTQEVYINLYKSFDRYKNLSENELKNIMCKIALNKCRDLLKAKYKKIEILADDDIVKLENYDDDTNLDDDIIKQDSSQYIRGVIDQLSEPYKSLLYSYYIEEQTLDEIAFCRNKSKGTIKMQLHRAREKLKEKLDKKGGASLL